MNTSKLCSVEKCNSLKLAKGYCSKHYTQTHKHGRLTPEVERKEKPLIYAAGQICSIGGCEEEVKSLSYCANHYMRYWRFGTTNTTTSRKDFYERSTGYIAIPKKGHLLADKTGCVYEHRYVYFEAYGGGPFRCFGCCKTLTWEALHIDHIDCDKKNNVITNLRPSCNLCNLKRGIDKAVETKRLKSPYMLNGRNITIESLSLMAGISDSAMSYRIKKWNIPTEEIVKIPKGKTGPKAK